MDIACLDLEGVLVPEIWIGVAKKTGIEELKATTRDIPNYDDLMTQRLGILDENNITIDDIQSVIAKISPFDGACQFLADLRENFQVVILSDTFYEFAKPLMKQLGEPTLLCHKLGIGEDRMIKSYHIRQLDPKRASVKAFHSLKYRVVAAGDSYNDTGMLEEADKGILFSPPENVIKEFPQYPVTTNYEELLREFNLKK